MFIQAGKTYSSRYDKKAPVHIAIISPDEDSQGARALCHEMVIAPINNKGKVEITCKTCQEKIESLQYLLAS